MPVRRRGGQPPAFNRDVNNKENIQNTHNESRQTLFDYISIAPVFYHSSNPAAKPLPVDRIGKVPVRGHKEVAALGDLPAGLVELDGRRRVVLLQSEAVGALALVEDVWRKLATLGVGRHDPAEVRRSGRFSLPPLAMSTNALVSYFLFSLQPI